MFRSAIARLLHPNGPLVSAKQILTGEVPIPSLQTRYIALVSADELLTEHVGNTGSLFATIELMETAGWEVVSIARDQVLTYAYMRNVTRPPSQPAPPPPYAAG